MSGRLLPRILAGCLMAGGVVLALSGGMGVGTRLLMLGTHGLRGPPVDLLVNVLAVGGGFWLFVTGQALWRGPGRPRRDVGRALMAFVGAILIAVGVLLVLFAGTCALILQQTHNGLWSAVYTTGAIGAALVLGGMVLMRAARGGGGGASP